MKWSVLSLSHICTVSLTWRVSYNFISARMSARLTSLQRTMTHSVWWWTESKSLLPTYHNIPIPPCQTHSLFLLLTYDNKPTVLTVTLTRWWEPTRSFRPIWGSMWNSSLWAMRGETQRKSVSYTWPEKRFSPVRHSQTIISVQVSITSVWTRSWGGRHQKNEGDGSWLVL